jgi:hypothetical protein
MTASHDDWTQLLLRLNSSAVKRGAFEVAGIPPENKGQAMVRKPASYGGEYQSR